MNSYNAPVAQEPRNKLTFSQAIGTATYQKAIANCIRDSKQANRFIASITSAVSANAELQTCDAKTVLSSALLGESLGLNPSQSLGHFYMVPFKQKAKYDRAGNLISPEKKTATFILGYKGYIQLALRSGAYRKLNVLCIKQGELVRFNPLTEDLEVKLIEDWNEREAAPTIGYYAMFEYLNGFQKAIYWSKEKMLSHADRYSMAFSKAAYQKLINGEIPESEMWKYSSFWYKDFDSMAMKTMLRQLISKWGMMSTELQTAIERDETVNTVDLSTGEVIGLTEDPEQPAQEEEPVEVEIIEPEQAPKAPARKRAASGKIDLGDL